MAGNYLGYAPIKSEGKSIHPACIHTCDRLGGIAEIERLRQQKFLLIEALSDMISDKDCLSDATLKFARDALAKARGGE